MSGSGSPVGFFGATRGGSRSPGGSVGWPADNNYGACNPPAPTAPPSPVIPPPIAPAPTPAAAAPPTPPAPVFVDTTPVGGAGELSFSGSSYGGAIPLVFGADKVAGNVFWAGPITTRSIQVDGKLLFYRTLDFAIAVAEGPINEILRIWMGDRLVYSTVMEVDAQGVPVPTADGYVNGYTIDVIDPDSPLAGVEGASDVTSLSIFKGGEDQIPYGIMVAEEGYLATPAYRGTAYIMFENFIVSSSSMPNIFIEVAANSDTDFPKNENAPEGSVLTAMEADVLLVDNTFRNVFYNASGTGDLNGFIQVDSGSLAQINEIEVEDVSLVPLGLNFEKFHQSVITESGNIVFPIGFATNGAIGVVSPAAGFLTSTLGPSTSGGFVDGDGIPGDIDDMEAFTAANADGDVRDFVAIAGGIKSDIGIAEITSVGEIFMNNWGVVFPSAWNKLCHMNVSQAMYSQTPQFADDSSNALGNYIFFGSHASGGTTTDMVFGRIPLGEFVDAGTLAATTMLTYSCDNMSGVGVSHVLSKMQADVDGNIVIWISSAGAADWMLKWNPRTNEILWKTPMNLYLHNQYPYSSIANLNGVRWSHIDPNDDLITIDLQSGVVEITVTDIVAAQGMNANYGLGRQYYDGAEDSIIYFSELPDRIDKVWVGRTGNVSTSLQTVVTNLLERVGVSPADMNISDFANTTLRGYTLNSVQSIRDSLSSLRKAFTYEVVESNGRYQYVSRGGASISTIPNARLADIDGAGAYLTTQREIDISQLRKLNLTYKDFDREYKQNVQSVFIPKTQNLGFDSDAALGVVIPVALTATEARYIADKLLYAKRVGEEAFTFTTGFRYAFLDPGDVVTVTISDTESVVMRITNVRVGQDYRINFEAVLEDPDIYDTNQNPGFVGSTGRYNESEFKQPDPVLIPYVLNIPCRAQSELLDSLTGGYVYYTVLNPGGAGTNPSEFSMSIQYDVTNHITTQTPATYPTWGVLTAAPEVISNPYTPQKNASITIKLANEKVGWELTSAASMAALIDDSSGALNLAALGDELIQFQTVTDLGNNVYQLTGLLRGLYGSETYYNARRAGDKFVLINSVSGVLDEGSIMQKELPVIDGLGVMKSGLSIVTNNPLQRATYGTWTHRSLKPTDVTNVDITFATGDYTLTWDKRSRYDWEFPDDGAEDVDYVLDEGTLEYDIVIASTSANVDPSDSTSYLRKERVVDVTTFDYTAAMQSEDGFTSGTDTLYVWVYQISSTVGDTLRYPTMFSIGPQ